jgi:glycosyltransferase involved in cell wall biosynthesis
MTHVAQIAVVVPAHNEVRELPRTLAALATAALCVPIPTLTVVVLDACTDGSAELAGRFGPDVHFLEADAGNVGAARAAGFEYARSACAHAPEDATWYATTDADSTVNANWLLRMTEADADMVLGVVRVSDWKNTPADVVRRYARAYHSRLTRSSHDHVHGANMGFRADAYWRLGGFRALPTGEDVELVERFESAGLRIRRDPQLSVATSARRDARAPGGFGAHLRSLARSRRQPTGDAA